ncbi:MAG TPA: hypothetical protein VGF40_08470 [Thermoanaerobaculia bacterium]
MAALAACSPGGDQETRTETIAPAVPPPAAPSDDPGLTQTTEIGEERSPSEGGSLTGEGAEEEPTTATTGTPAPARPKPKRD